jgi:23S rRNA (adenine2503-C2)-methyltransferase
MNLADLERAEIEQAMAGLGIPSYHGRQIFRWLYRRGVSEFEAMTDLSRPVRAALARAATISTPAIAARQCSADGTTKFLLQLDDGRRIEAVYIPDTPVQTFCISTQVGCAMGCEFCLTGKMGLTRHLTAGEIAGQVRVLAHATGLAARSFNIVLMGMGEPLHNYDATMKALRMLADEHGLAVHPRRITLSTVGFVPALKRLATEPVVPNLAISLHATTTASRNALVPLNRRYDLTEVIQACKSLPLGGRRRVTFEYVLLAGVNDTPEDARRLVRLLNGLKAKVNLLPLNEAPGLPFTRPSDERVNAFAKILADRDVRVSVRKSRGRDIRAACGQLIVESERPSAAERLAARLP